MENHDNVLPSEAEPGTDRAIFEVKNPVLQPQSEAQELSPKVAVPEGTSQSTSNDTEESRQEMSQNTQDNSKENAVASQTDAQERVISVEDHEEFIQAHMPTLKDEVEDTQIFRWKLSEWDKLPEKLLSPEFSCGDYKWRLSLFPRGNTTASAGHNVSLYLEWVDSETSEDLHVCAQFALAISNPDDPTIFFDGRARHRFTYESPDWGFTRFREYVKLHQPAGSQSKPIIENGSTVFHVFIRVVKDITGVLWHDFENYNSKEFTGYVGLENQGVTRYLNAALYSLYFTPCLRKAIYQIPTDGPVPRESMALALQRLFYQLGTSDHQVATNELTKSFGWKQADLSLQRDVQEFNRVLQDKIESKLEMTKEGTAGEGWIRKFLAGRRKSNVRCTEVDFESSTVDDFYDIQLNVKGPKTLRESFQTHLLKAMLAGENKYHTEGLGPQEAEKGVTFLSFPPILYIQLKRFEYNPKDKRLVKVDDRQEYPSEIDLEEFLDPSADKSESHIYQLHGVIVHEGGDFDDRYTTMIKPSPESGWFKFDDDRVIPVTIREVFDDNFGASHQNQRMEEEDRIRAEQKRRELAEQNLYLNVKVTTERSFRQHQDFDLATFVEEIAPLSRLTEHRILKEELYSSFKSIVAQHIDLSVDQIRFWVMIQRQNRTIRPQEIIPDNEPTLSMRAIRNAATIRSNPSELRLFLDVYSDNFGDRHATRDPLAIASATGSPETNTIMIFLKHFDPKKQRIISLCKAYVQVEDFVHQSLTPTICERMKWPAETVLQFFEEIKPGMIESIGSNKTFSQAEIQNGDIICSQLEISETEAAELEAQELCSSATAFYDRLHRRVKVHFGPKEENPNLPVKTTIREPSTVKDPRFALIFEKGTNYETMLQKVADHLGCDPQKLRLTVPAKLTSDGSTELERVIKSAPNFRVPGSISYKNGIIPVLVYEILGESAAYIPG